MTLKEILGIFVAIFVLSTSLFIAFLSWKYADYFLSRRDKYINSSYKLFITKAGWTISVFLLSLGLISSLLKTIFK